MTRNLKKLAGILMAFAAALALSMLVVGCSSGASSGGASDDTAGSSNDGYSSIGCSNYGDALEIEAENAGSDMETIQTMTFDSDVELTATSELSAGTVHITFYDGSSIADIDSVDVFNIDVSQLDSVFEYVVTGEDSDTLVLGAGSYVVYVTGDDSAPATGTVTLAMQ